MFAGIDVGSRVTKSVILNNEGIISYSLLDSGTDPRKAGERTFSEALSKADCKREDINFIVATGYGRVSLHFADKTVTELTCHARGAYHVNPNVRTLIDIGGQDSKIIRLDEGGRMVNFVINDKCAAGTGKFLEVMSQTLEIRLEEMGEFSLRSKNPCSVNSTCTVFAESEVISLLSSRKRVEDIIAGLHQAVGRRVGNMARGLGISKEVVFVGGVARNIGVKKALENFLGVEFATISKNPQIIGVLGAALLAKEYYENG